MIKIGDYPQLQAICWNRRGGELLTPAGALAIYERNWFYVDQDQLTHKESALIEELRITVGNGVLCV